MVEVVRRLLERLGGDGGDLRVGGAGQRCPLLVLVRGIQQLPAHGHGEVAVLQLHEKTVDELAFVTQEGIVVLRAAAAVERGGVRIQGARLAEQVESDVGERDILLQRGCARRPLRQAVREHERVVGEVQHADAGLRRDRAHSCFTSLGMS